MYLDACAFFDVLRRIGEVRDPTSYNGMRNNVTSAKNGTTTRLGSLRIEHEKKERQLRQEVSSSPLKVERKKMKLFHCVCANSVLICQPRICGRVNTAKEGIGEKMTLRDVCVQRACKKNDSRDSQVKEYGNKLEKI